MKKEIIFQIVLVILFYLDSIFELTFDGISLSDTPVIDLLFLVYHCILFFLVTYYLIPKFFYKKKYFQFFLWVLILIALFGLVEEGIVEKILDPFHKGANEVTWQSVYWFFGEILVPLLAFVTVKIMFDNFAQQQEIEQIKQDNLTNELKLLKSQVQPHVLFNSLNNLYNFALQKSDQVPDLILKLSNVLRYVLYEASEDKVTLAKELNLIKDYVDLQEIQYKGRGNISLQINDNSKNQKLKIAPFLLIPLVENSFKHSFGTLVDKVIVDINIQIYKEQISLHVKNNYDIDEGTSNALVVGGIGLINVKKRLDLLYPRKYKLHTRSENKNFFAELNITLN